MSKQCYTDGDFQKYFNENMRAMGAPVPKGIFESYDKAVATAGALAGTLHLLGKGATITELFVATTGLEKIAIMSVLSASFYVGIVIGSISVAAGRSATCGSRLSDMFVFMRQNGLEFEGWERFYLLNPQILDKSYRSKRGIISTGNFEYA